MAETYEWPSLTKKPSPEENLTEVNEFKLYKIYSCDSGYSSFVKANPLGTEIVTRRMTIQVSRREVVELKVPLRPLSETRTVGHLLPQLIRTRYPLMLELGGLLPQLAPGYQVPIQ